MIYRHNSTIGIRERPCSSCGKDRPIFSKGRCQECAKIEDTHAKITASQMEEGGLPELRDALDAMISYYVRYSNLDENGFATCFTCGRKYRPADLDAGHYITRECMYLRFDLRNIKPQCRDDNRRKSGLAAEFGKRLEEENPGVTEVLLEESKIIYKYSRSELEQLIVEFKAKNKVQKTSL